MNVFRIKINVIILVVVLTFFVQVIYYVYYPSKVSHLQMKQEK